MLPAVCHFRAEGISTTCKMRADFISSKGKIGKCSIHEGRKGPGENTATVKSLNSHYAF